MGTIEIGDLLIRTGDTTKYLTNGKLYKVVMSTLGSFSIIDDIGEEFIVTKFSWNVFSKVYKA